jgi:bifunctional DNA-binding transcriptional regulator/antitoxin component of YhaV-PrlF toxin-antitoxin module
MVLEISIERNIFMIAISILKIDNRGRITLPEHFLKANNIKKGGVVGLYPVYNRKDSVRIEFQIEE